MDSANSELSKKNPDKPCPPAHIMTIKPYPPGKPLEELEREYGISDSVKLASNENPLGPSPNALEAIRRNLDNLHRYPDGSGYYLRKRLSQKYNTPFEGIVLGNGSNEIIELAIRAFVTPKDEVILPAPSFLVYQLAVQTMGGKSITIPLKDYTIDLDGMCDAITARTKLIFINNPNNPTGTIVRRQQFESFLHKIPPQIILMLDEAYIEFVQDQDTPLGTQYVERQGPFTVVLRTFSKAYGLAGLRIGYGMMHPQIADILNRVRQPFNTGSLSQAAALAAIDDEDFLSRTKQTVWEGLAYLYGEIEKIGLDYIPSQTNFFLIDVGCDAREVYERMLRLGVIIRSMGPYGLPNHIRVNVGRPEENERFINALKCALDQIGKG